MLRKLLSATIVYGMSTILARLVNYALVVMHTDVFQDASDYGVISVFYAYAVFLNVIYLYGMETAFFRFASKKEADPQQVFSLILTAVLVSSLAFSSVIWLTSDSIAQLLGYAGQGRYVRWFALLLAIDAVAAIPFAKMRKENKAALFAGYKLLNVVVNVGLNAFFLYFCPAAMKGAYGAGVQAFVEGFFDPNALIGYPFLANLLANALYIPLLIPLLMRWRPQFTWVALKPMLAYGLPLLFSGLAFATNEALDRAMLPYWLPDGYYASVDALGATGVYSACYKLSIFITLGVQAFKYAVEPFFFAKAEDEDGPERFAVVMKYFALTLTLMFAGVALNMDWLAVLFIRNATYREGLYVVPFLLMANVFLGLYYNLSVWYKVTDKTRYGLYISLLGATITVLGNVALIPVLGYLGSALVTLACYMAMALTSYAIGQKHYPVPYDVKTIGLYLFGASAFVAVGLLVPVEGVWVGLTFRNGLLLAFLLLAFWPERKRILSSVRR